ncbi:MAG: molybdopterin molybdotransferase MoeA [Calditrichaeota bacterium]|nr:molybdopterin molybdotransferase MoeA [Calditrichota bacterium]
MTHFEDALSRTIAENPRLAPVEVPVTDAMERILARDVISPVNLPPFSQAKSDGFAINSQDSRNKKAVHEVIGTVLAGKFPDKQLQRGQAMEIEAEAPVPVGSDAVAPMDAVRVVMEGARVGILKKIRNGENVALAGEMLEKGELLLPSGTYLTPLEIGMLTMIGIDRVRVFPPPKVGVLSVGNELVEVGKRVIRGRLWDAIGLSLAAALYESGAQPEYLGPVNHEQKAFEGKLKSLAGYHFILITGFSGEKRKTLILDVLKKFGVRWQITNIGMVPGGEVRIGKIKKTTVCLLPADLFEITVFFEAFLTPVLRTMMGFPSLYPMRVEAILDDSLRKKGDYHLFQPAQISFKNEKIVAKKISPLGKGTIFELARSNGFISVPRQVTKAKSGKPVDVILRKLLF